jgi:hypothetical protein
MEREEEAETSLALLPKSIFVLRNSSSSSFPPFEKAS